MHNLRTNPQSGINATIKSPVKISPVPIRSIPTANAGLKRTEQPDKNRAIPTAPKTKASANTVAISPTSIPNNPAKRPIHMGLVRIIRRIIKSSSFPSRLFSQNPLFSGMLKFSSSELLFFCLRYFLI